MQCVGFHERLRKITNLYACVVYYWHSFHQCTVYTLLALAKKFKKESRKLNVRKVCGLEKYKIALVAIFLFMNVLEFVQLPICDDVYRPSLSNNFGSICGPY